MPATELDGLPPAVHSARLDRAMAAVGFGKYQLLLACIPCLMMACDSMIITLLSVIRRDVAGDLTVTETSSLQHPEAAKTRASDAEVTITLVMFAGMLVGAPAVGALSDARGRRLATIVSALLMVAGLVVMSVSPGGLMGFYLGDWLCGVGAGGMHVAQTLLAEFLPPASRDVVMAVYASFWTTGIALESIMFVLWDPHGPSRGRNLSPASHTNSHHHHIGNVSTHAAAALSQSDAHPEKWRFLCAPVTAVPAAMVCCAALFLLKETPRFLLLKGKQSAADKVVLAMSRANGTHAATADALRLLPPPSPPSTTPDGRSNGATPPIADYGTTSTPGGRAARKSPGVGDDNDTDGDDDHVPVLMSGSGGMQQFEIESPSSNNNAAAGDDGATTPTTSGGGGGGGWTSGVRRFGRLLAPGLRGTTLRLWTLWLVCTAAYYLTVLAAPAAAAAAASGGDDGNDGAAAPVTVSGRSLILQAVIEYPSYALQYLIGKYLGRRRGLVVSTVAAGATCAVIALLAVHGAVSLVSGLMVARLAVMVLFNVLWLATPEAFPTELRSTGCGACSAVSRMAGFAAPILLLGDLPPIVYAAGAAAAFVACAAAAFTLPRETASAPLRDTITAT